MVMMNDLLFQIGISITRRMRKKAVQQGRSERRGESYSCGTVSREAMRERRWRTFSASC
ncbi:hypothetical protein NSND_61373 [Nitrospira sp. ND1]|nr:hypothetical protein NSND_61373 [Nitrospira sp. ND1]